MRAADAPSGLTEVSATVDGAAAGADAARPTAPGRAVPPRRSRTPTHVVRFHATDAAGNVTATAAAFTVADRVAPVVDGFTGGADGFAFAARDADSGIGVAGLAVALDGRDVDAAGTFAGGIFRYVAPARLAAGMHAVMVRATDGVGNVTDADLDVPGGRPAGAARAAVPGRRRHRHARAPPASTCGPTAGRSPSAACGSRSRGAPAAPPGRPSPTSAASPTSCSTAAGRASSSPARPGCRRRLVVRLAHGVTLRAARRVPHAVELSGSVMPAPRAIVIEAYAAGRWQAVRTMRVPRGVFATRIRLRRKGLYIFRATTGDVRSPAVQVLLR